MLGTADTTRVLSQYPVLSDISADTRSLFVEKGTAVTARDGQVLLEQGAMPQQFIFPIEGGTRAVIRTAENREITLDRVNPGDCCTLSASCLVGGCPAPARGVAEGALRAIALPADLFFKMMDETPSFRKFVLAGISGRLNRLVETIERVTFQTVEQRLASALLERPHPIRTTHHALAMELGSVREIISRHLKTFENRGLVALARQRIEVLDRDGLRGLLSANGNGNGAVAAN